mgnify:CR=1 FL=1
MSSRSRSIVLTGLVAVMAVCLVVAAVDDGAPRTEVERIQALNEAFACPECDGQSVAESNAAVAANIRDFIRQQVAAGEDDDTIRDRLIASYGSDVLLRPPSDGVSALIWILPVVVVVAGGAAVVASIRRRGQALTVTDEDRRLVAAARSARPDPTADA